MSRKPNLTSDVLNAVKAGKTKAREIAKFVLGNENSVRSALSRLTERGEINQVSRGEYKPLSPPFFQEEVQGWYMSGLQYGRDVGVIIYGVSEDEAEIELREYLAANVANYNDGFYGLGSISYDGFSELEEIQEVNL